MVYNSSSLEHSIASAFVDVLGKEALQKGVQILAACVAKEWCKAGTTKSLDIYLKNRVSHSVYQAAEASVLQKMQRHSLLGLFDIGLCKVFDNIFYHNSESAGPQSVSYDLIVKTMNFGRDESLIEYPDPDPKSEQVKKQRLVVQDAIKIWWRQVKQPGKKRLPEFTNDEAWFSILQYWHSHDTSSDNPILRDCKITAGIAPDCYQKFILLRKLQAECYLWDRKKINHLLEYAPCLRPEEWPDSCWQLEFVLEKVKKEMEAYYDL